MAPYKCLFIFITFCQLLLSLSVPFNAAPKCEGHSHCLSRLGASACWVSGVEGLVASLVQRGKRGGSKSACSMSERVFGGVVFHGLDGDGAGMRWSTGFASGNQRETTFRGDVSLCAKKRGGDGAKKPSKEKLEELQAKEDAKNAAVENPGTAPLSKKQARLGSTGKAPPPPDKAPLRVSTQSLMSAKTQIRLLKAIAVQEKKSTQTVYRTKFRQKDKDTGEEDDAASKASPSGVDLWSSLKEPPLFLVDGYNIIGLWPKLKKKKISDDMDGARTLLQQELVQFASYRGCVIELVYDAVGSSIGGASTDSITEDLMVVWARDRSADNYIEGRAMDVLKESPTKQCWVCTNDRAIQDLAKSYGANTMSANLLIQEIKRATKEAEGSLRDPDAFSLKGGMMEDRISSDVAALLNDMIFEQHYGKKRVKDESAE